MDDEIDLRPNLRALLRHWKLIALLSLLAAAVAAPVSLLLPDQYEAAATISISLPPNALRPEIGAQIAPNPLRAYVALPRSSDRVAEVFALSAPSLPSQINSPSKLAALLTTETTSDPTLLRLKVRDTDPLRAAAIANTWASVMVASAGQLFPQDQANLTHLQGQLDAAQAQLTQAGAALAAFQSSSQAAVFTAQLNAQQAALTEDLERQHRLQLLAQDLHSLAEQLNALPPFDPVQLTDDLALAAITVRLYGALDPTSAESSVPLPVQIGPGQSLAGPAVVDQAAYAQKLDGTLTAWLADSAGQASSVQAQIDALQGQIASAAASEAGLIQARDLAQAQVALLAGLVQAASLYEQAAFNSIKIVGPAEVPSAPLASHRASSVLLAGALGLALGVLLAALLELRQWAGVGRFAAASDAAQSPQPAAAAPSRQA